MSVNRIGTKVLALDISTKTGWAMFTEGDLTEHGIIKLPKKVSEFGEYPWSYCVAAYTVAKAIFDLTSKEPDVIVIEEVNKARARYSQKILEWIHYATLNFLSSTKIPVKYVNSSEWRKVLGLVMSKEDKKANKKLKTAKQMAEMIGSKLNKAELGIKGTVTKKHLSVRFVNERFGLDFKVKDNDKADAICLGLAFILGAKVCDGE